MAPGAGVQVSVTWAPPATAWTPAGGASCGALPPKAWPLRRPIRLSQSVRASMLKGFSSWFGRACVRGSVGRSAAGGREDLLRHQRAHLLLEGALRDIAAH